MFLKQIFGQMSLTAVSTHVSSFNLDLRPPTYFLIILLKNIEPAGFFFEPVVLQKKMAL